MDRNLFNTDEIVRKSGSHLTLAERGMIQALHKEGMSLRGIAKNVGCAHTTVYYELKRGTPPHKSNRGRITGYTAKRGQEAYTANRRHSNMLWANKLPLSLFDLPHALGQKKHRKWNRKNKRMLGRSIEERPAIANAGTEIGHWEVDTVVGRRQGREAVIFTAVEKGYKDLLHTPIQLMGTSQNERHNGLMRDDIPKGTSIERYSDEDILSIADALNQRPRRILGYHTPTELFDHFLDEVYAVENCS